MKNIIFALAAVFTVSACSDKSAMTSKEDTWTGSFVATETSGGEKKVRRTNIKGETIETEFTTPVRTNRKFVVVTADKYQEIMILEEEGETPILKERNFVVSQNEEGQIELELVSDECGTVTSSEKVVWSPNTNPGSVQSYDGAVLVRENPETVKKQMEEVLANKQNDVYAKDCSQTARNIENFWKSLWD